MQGSDLHTPTGHLQVWEKVASRGAPTSSWVLQAPPRAQNPEHGEVGAVQGEGGESQRHPSQSLLQCLVPRIGPGPAPQLRLPFSEREGGVATPGEGVVSQDCAALLRGAGAPTCPILLSIFLISSPCRSRQALGCAPRSLQGCVPLPSRLGLLLASHQLSLAQVVGWRGSNCHTAVHADGRLRKGYWKSREASEGRCGSAQGGWQDTPSALTRGQVSGAREPSRA